MKYTICKNNTYLSSVWPSVVWRAAFLEKKNPLIRRSPREALLYLGPFPGGVPFHCWLPLCVLAAMHHSSLQATWQMSSDLSRGDTRTAPHILSHPHPPCPAVVHLSSLTPFLYSKPASQSQTARVKYMFADACLCTHNRKSELYLFVLFCSIKPVNRAETISRFIKLEIDLKQKKVKH